MTDKPTYEELEMEITILRSTIDDQDKLIAEQAIKIKDLIRGKTALAQIIGELENPILEVEDNEG